MESSKQTSLIFQLLREITFYLGFEATRTLKNTDNKIKTPMNVDFSGKKRNPQIRTKSILYLPSSVIDTFDFDFDRVCIHV